MANTEAVDAAIVVALAEVEAGWNRFELDAYINHYTDDATYVTRQRAYVRGRDAIKSAHRTAWDAAMRDWRIRIEPVFARAIGNDHVLVHARLRFETPADATGPGESMATVLLVRTPDGYRIQAAQTTAVSESARV